MTRLIAASLLVLLLSAGVYGQARLTGGDLEGTATDETGAVLPGVTITVTNTETGVARGTQTGPRGQFRVPALAPGTYEIRADLASFVSQIRQGVVLALGQLATVDFTMRVAGTQESVTVTGETAIVDPMQSAVSSVVGQQQIESLPINGRNFISFSVITPGVTTDRTPQQGATVTSGLSFAGQRARSNNIMVDGFDNNEAAVGSVGAQLQPGGGPRIPGADELVLGRVRQSRRRRREHRHQERHERLPGRCLRVSAGRGAQRQRPLRALRSVRQCD